MSNKGYIYAIVTLILALLLLAAVSLYYSSYKISAELNPTKMRTDELHYFVESAKKDLSRAMVISGRRGAVYMIDHVIHTGVPLNDSEQTLKELILNGTITINGSTINVTYLKNHTLSVWLDKINKSGERLGFDVNITFSSMDIYPYDSWHFIEIIALNLDISDKEGMCRYERSNVRIYSLVSIIGLEDVLYPLNTANKIRRGFRKSNRTESIEVLATGINGKGIGGGKVFDVSDENESDQGDNITAYNSTYPELVNYTVFVIDVDDFYNDLSDDARNVLNSSGGVIDYYNESLDAEGFPYVSGVSKLNFSGINYVALRNNGKHEILRLLINDDIEGELYHSSKNGSCFFDRLEGNLNLSEKYKNRSKELIKLLDLSPDTEIGLESFVNVNNFAEYKLYEFGILPAFIDQSSVDYLYLQDISGKRVYGTPEWFRLDDEHCAKYNLTEFCHT
ncbi:MAG: hypothetical protein DRO76_01820 [Candidatus Altiarchaeales archaeon]|nr:MAG: hypothetical protein DRO76_01820 [Candidatus Altiarchaeales archaeon]